MHVLTAAPRPHRYVSGGRHTIVARGRCMIAHSFTGLIFGPAQALHGCTYVIDARLSADGLLEDSELACTRAEAESALADALRVYHQRSEACQGGRPARRPHEDVRAEWAAILAAAGSG